MRKGGRTRSRRAILVFVFTSPACAVCPPASTGGDSHGGKIRKKVKRKRNSHNQDPEVFFFSLFSSIPASYSMTHTQENGWQFFGGQAKVAQLGFSNLKLHCFFGTDDDDDRALSFSLQLSVATWDRRI